MTHAPVVPDCLFKEAFRTEGHARRAIRLSRAQHHWLLRAFRCRWCKHWHLTGLPEREPLEPPAETEEDEP